MHGDVELSESVGLGGISEGPVVAGFVESIVVAEDYSGCVYVVDAVSVWCESDDRSY